MEADFGELSIRGIIFSIIDGNYKMEKALRMDKSSIYTKLRGERLIPYFINEKGYQSLVEYWNSKS